MFTSADGHAQVGLDSLRLGIRCPHDPLKEDLRNTCVRSINERGSIIGIGGEKDAITRECSGRGSSDRGHTGELTLDY